MGAVGKLSIWYLLFWFVLYLVGHYLIGKQKEILVKKDRQKPGNPDTEKQLKQMTFIFKWFPAMYLILVLIILYAS